MQPLDIPGALSERECRVLGDVAVAAGASHALEVGRFCGRSTVVLLQALPPTVALTTIDHHRGDAWAGATDPGEVWANIFPHVGFRTVDYVNADMLAYEYVGPYDFVFYDADHSATAVSTWWERVRSHLAPRCTLVFDDADWRGQGVLENLAVLDGFAERYGPNDWYRGQQDKNDPQTFTLQVMRRG